MSDAFFTGPSPLDLAVTSIVDRLTRHGFHFHDGALGTPTHREDDKGYDISQSPLMLGLLDCFDLRADWFLRDLKAPPATPEWHAIYVPHTSPIPLEDYLLVAESEAKALAYVLEGINAVRASVGRVYRDSEGTLILDGEAEPIARIKSIAFQSIREPLLRRAEKALSGLRASPRGADYACAFKKLPGFGPNAPFSDMYDIPVPTSTDHDPRRGLGYPMLYPTCSNLATAIGRVLEKLVIESLPRHLALEMAALFCGFPDWNHFVGAEKQRPDALLKPYCLFEIREDIPDFDQPHSFYQGLPAALIAYGNALKNQSAKSTTVHTGMHFYFTNREKADHKSFMDGGARYVPDSGIQQLEITRCAPPQPYIELAATMLASDDIERFLREYTHAELSLKERVLAFNRRKGATEEDHLFIGEWVYWVGGSENDRFFVAERLSEIGREKVGPSICASLHKAALIERPDGIYLATDWNRKPRDKLPGLDQKSADLLEQTFFDRSNHRSCHPPGP